MGDKIRYHKDKLKEDLINKGLEHLIDVGFENFSIREVAKNCNVSHNAPYRHFKNKNSLILAITIKAIDEFNSCLKIAFEKFPDDITKQLKEMGYLYIKFFKENPRYLNLLFLSDILNRIDKEEAPEKFYEYPFNTFIKVMEGVEIENKKGFDKNALILSLWSKIHGLAIIVSRNEFPYNGDIMELVEKIIWEDY